MTNENRQIVAGVKELLAEASRLLKGVQKAQQDSIDAMDEHAQEGPHG
ncbi:MAG: hypothetical protein JO107_06415, partial [Hyphomicrobiales bacterium]|nr:hypothetical protein [Hyphomicrobiales bacterium]MBV8662719.1 hypothetical protein [Hyphomicrobiales bacterium]